MKNDSSSRSLLLTKIYNDRELLVNWTKLPIANAHFGGWLRFPNMSKAFWLYCQTDLGGIGQTSIKIQNISMDADQNGIISEEELANNKELQEQLLEEALALLGTLGVVGALIFSVLYSTVVSPLTTSGESSDFFSSGTLTTFKYVYYFCVYFALARSFTTIYTSVMFYLKLSFWMPSLELKIWLITERSIAPIVNNACGCLIAASIAIPFGVAVAVSPGAALIAIIMEVITVVGFMVEYADNFDCCIKLHQCATEILKVRHDPATKGTSNPLQGGSPNSH